MGEQFSVQLIAVSFIADMFGDALSSRLLHANCQSQPWLNVPVLCCMPHVLHGDNQSFDQRQASHLQTGY